MRTMENFTLCDSKTIRSKITFTISLSPALSRGNVNILSSHDTIVRLKKYKHRIHDINFTYHMEPFTVDAHGVYLSEAEQNLHLTEILAIQSKTGIPVTPVFNNIYAPNTYTALETFLSNFEKLYDLGIRSISIPHVLWMKMKDIKNAFPGVHIKNTVLRRVRDAQEFWNNAEAGFDYINIDRVLIRNIETLKDIRKAQQLFLNKTGKHVLISILEGEGCLGACALWDEHYQHTLTNPQTKQSLHASLETFRYPQAFSCNAIGDPDFNILTSVGFPFFNEDVNEICQYIDVIKLAGRRSIYSLNDCILTIDGFDNPEGDFAKPVPEYLNVLLKPETEQRKKLDEWRKIIKNCCFQCWKCSACTNLFLLASSATNK